MANALRTFIALPVPGHVTGFLKQTQDRLRPLIAGVRWVPAANVHLTLKFLGDVDPAMVPEIVSGMEAAARSVPSFALSAKAVGVFPNRRKARVIWVGLAGERKPLDTLHHSLESGLAGLGFKPEHRAFRAHLTIGRIRRRPNPETLARSLEPFASAVSEPFEVDQMRLYQSVLKPTGAEYTLLHTAPLAPSDATITP